MAKESDNEILKRSDTHGIAELTLNRPEARNALSTALMDRLQTELDRIRDDKDIHVVVIAANGPSYCSGHDLRELRAMPTQKTHKMLFAQCSWIYPSTTEYLRKYI